VAWYDLRPGNRAVPIIQLPGPTSCQWRHQCLLQTVELTFLSLLHYFHGRTQGGVKGLMPPKLPASATDVEYVVNLLNVNRTHTHTTVVLWPFVLDYPGEPVPEETLTHPPSWSSSNLYQLLPSTTIHSILRVQITCLAIFLHNLFPCPVWSTSIRNISSPNQCLLFADAEYVVNLLSVNRWL